MWRSSGGRGGGEICHRVPFVIQLTQPPTSSREGVAGAACRPSDEHGVTSVEYALIGILVAIAIIGGAAALGDELGATYDDISTQFGTVLP